MTTHERKIVTEGPDRQQIERAIAALRDALTRLRFGAVELTVHDGNIVQMEITEKRRFDR